MIVTRSTPADLPALAALGALFFAEGRLPGKFHAAHWIATWTQLLTSGVGVMWHLEDTALREPCATLGALLFPDPCTGDLVAQEAFWYVLPAARGLGLKLLATFESWAAEAGAARVMMVHLTALQPERLGLLYQRRGYEPVETHYVKHL